MAFRLRQRHPVSALDARSPRIWVVVAYRPAFDFGSSGAFRLCALGSAQTGAEEFHHPIAATPSRRPPPLHYQGRCEDWPTTAGGRCRDWLACASSSRLRGRPCAPHLARMPLAIGQNEAPHPADIRFLGAQRQAKPAHARTHLVEQARPRDCCGTTCRCRVRVGGSHRCCRPLGKSRKIRLRN